MHVLPIPAFQESDSITKQVVVLHLHGAGMCFHATSKISIQYS